MVSGKEGSRIKYGVPGIHETARSAKALPRAIAACLSRMVSARLLAKKKAFAARARIWTGSFVWAACRSSRINRYLILLIFYYTNPNSNFYYLGGSSSNGMTTKSRFSSKRYQLRCGLSESTSEISFHLVGASSLPTSSFLLFDR